MIWILILGCVNQRLIMDEDKISKKYVRSNGLLAIIYRIGANYIVCHRIQMISSPMPRI